MKVKNLNYSIKDNIILKDITFNLSTNDVNVIIGRNGVGKSTLLDIMAKAYKSYKDHLIDFPGENEIAYQLQGVPFLTTLKGSQIVDFFLNSDYKKEKINLDEEEDTMMKKLKNKKLGEMSGGERRWLIVMCICSLDRKLYIFDEPLSGIDPIFSEKILKKFKKLANDNKTVVLTTHQFDYLESINPNILYIKEGKIIFCGDYEKYLNLSEEHSVLSSYKYLNGDYNAEI